MNNKGKTTNQSLYEREIKRLKRLVKIAENKGVIFTENVIPDKPKIITKKRLAEIYGITKSQIESKGFTINQETGELQPFIPSKISRPRRLVPLTKEELHIIRVQAGKKAAETIKRRGEEDYSFKEYIEKTRRKNLEKGRIIKEFKDEPPFDDSFLFDLPNETPIEEKKEESENVEIEEPSKNKQVYAPWQNDEDYYERTAPQGGVIIEEIKSMIDGGRNPNVGKWLIDLLDDEIDTYGIQEVERRLAKSSEASIEQAQTVAYESTDNNKLFNASIYLAELITDNNLSAGLRTSIAEEVNKDIPPEWSFNRRNSKRGR